MYSTLKMEERSSSGVIGLAGYSRTCINMLMG